MRLKLLLVSVLVAGSGCAQSSDVAIIVHKDVPVDNLSFGEVRKVFRSDRQYWNSNLRVTLLVRAPAARERDVVLRKIYDMSEAQYRQYWIAKIFRAEATAGPKTVYSNDMTSELVTGIPGAISFVDAARIPAGCKVLKIDGLKPGEKGYPLR